MNDQDPKSLLAALAAREAQRRPSKAERRVFERFPIRCEAVIVPDSRWDAEDLKSDASAYVRDASRGGLGVVGRQKLVIGRPYRLVCMSDTVELFSTEITPRHVSLLADGVWCAGTAFLAEGARLVALGVSASALRASEDGGPRYGGEFSGVAA